MNDKWLLPEQGQGDKQKPSLMTREASKVPENADLEIEFRRHTDR